jgi:phage replication O-like protein O
MASPQKENGYTAIANQIMDKLCMTRIPGEARQVLDFIIRKTYGFNKTEDAIALSQFVNGTGLKKTTVIKALSKLRDMNIITQMGYKVANKYSFNKDFDKWIPLPKKVTLPNRVITVTNMGHNRNPKRDIQKTVTKDTITKDRETPAQEAQDFFNNIDKQAKLVLLLVSKGMNELTAAKEIQKFISFWTERNKTGTKQKWEMQDTFEIKRRLTTWFSNADKFNKTTNQRKIIKL